MLTDFVLPNWVTPAHERLTISDEAYLTWLSEERAWLVRERQLEKLRTDPARRPVDARFVL
ncbi:MAG: hypothetical protein QOH39_1981 [Verrucomicrobiota bacterium]|jgi:hypothetical protein